MDQQIRVPVPCHNCHHIFWFHPPMGSMITMRGNKAGCPKCRHISPLPDISIGNLEAGEIVIQHSQESLRILALVLGDYLSGNITEEEAKERLPEEMKDPESKFGKLLPKDFKEGLAGIATIFVFALAALGMDIPEELVALICSLLKIQKSK